MNTDPRIEAAARAIYSPGRAASPLEAQVHFKVALVVTNVSHWPDAAVSHLMGRDLSGPIDRLVEALLPVIAKAQAEAWDAGHDAGDTYGYQRNEFEHMYVDQLDVPTNPYRSTDE